MFQLSKSLCILGALSFCFSLSVYSKPMLTMKWGLENTSYFIETQVPATASSAISITAKDGETLYRFFKTNSKYSAIINGIGSQHWESWGLFQKDNSWNDSELKKNYADFLRQKNPFLFGQIHDIAPTLYFDFIGVSGTEYILKEIHIQTIKFEEYAGGGFADKEAWYDIELKHIEGTALYPIADQSLKFTGSGRSVLRFWSDNYYRNQGLAPMGCYDLNITFIFYSNGAEVSVSTGRFKIDV